MIERFFFTVQQAWRHRSSLKQANQQRFKTLCHIPMTTLEHPPLKVLLLDFDGVMANHGATAAYPEIMRWCQNVHRVFPGLRVFLLTNKPFAARTLFFKSQLPFIEVPKPQKKKPYPDGILAILEQTGVAPEAALLVDDRLCTGGLAAILTGIRFILIEAPFIKLWQQPVAESFFWLLRRLERFFF